MLHTCWLLCTKGHLLSSQKISKVTKEKLFPVVLQYAFFCSHSWSKRTLCGWCVRVFVSIFISVCKPARKKIPNAHSLDDLDVHVYHCLSRKRQTKEGPSSKAIINLLSVQIWAAKTSHISAFSCCGTACTVLIRTAFHSPIASSMLNCKTLEKNWLRNGALNFHPLTSYQNIFVPLEHVGTILMLIIFERNIRNHESVVTCCNHGYSKS